jgi:hypothetical protein
VKFFIGVGGLWIAALLLWADFPLLLCFDDAFYYFTIARRFAAGEGSTFDGINPTNGYHPAWMAICIGFSWLFQNPDMLVQALLILQVVLYLSALYQLSTPESRGAILIAGAGPLLARAGINGLESALYACVLAGILKRGNLKIWALAFLARTDAILVVPAEVLVALRTRRLDRLVELIPLLLIAAIYMLLNQYFFGTPLQVSGSIKRLPVGLVQGVEIIVGLGLWWGALLGLAKRAPPQTRAVLEQTEGYGLFCGILMLYYLIFQAFPQLWYFLPVVLWGLRILGAFLEDLQALVPDPKRFARQFMGILALGLIPQSWVLASPATRAHALTAKEAALWLKAELPDATLGSWDAGLLGFYSGCTVINLDGLVNSKAYQEAAARGEAGPFLKEQGLQHLINHNRQDFKKGGKPLELIQVAQTLLGPVELIEQKRWPFVYMGASNRSAPGQYAMAVYLLKIRWPQTAEDPF